jgi:hypothetical protein
VTLSRTVSPLCPENPSIGTADSLGPMTDDPLRGSPYSLGDPLHNGRVLHEALTSTEHYRDALTTIETLAHDDLAHLALYVAADAAATRAEQQQSGQVWLDWWRGIDTADPPTGDTTPGMLWPIVRPAGGDPDAPPLS